MRVQRQVRRRARLQARLHAQQQQAQREQLQARKQARQHKRRQRVQQQAAVAARERGEVFESTRRTTFPKRKPLEARKEAERIVIRKSENAARRRTVQKAIKADRAKAPDVVVVPIYWKGEAKQMARVLLACADAEKALEASK